MQGLGIETKSTRKVAVDEDDGSPTRNASFRELPEFELVAGGPVYRLFRWTGLCDANLLPLYRRPAVIAAIVWLPLLLLSLVEGRAYPTPGIDVPFANDIESHVKFLIALPLLLADEALARRVLAPLVSNFLTRNIVRNGDVSRFKAAVNSAYRTIDSFALEVVLVVIVYTVGIWVRSNFVSTAYTWRSYPEGSQLTLTLAGYWMTLVSIPVYQFFLIRWYARIFIWFIFLWRVSRLHLHLIATHSDRAGGIGFLAKSPWAFVYFLLAQGTQLSGYIAGQVLNHGQDPTGFKLVMASFVAFLLIVVFGPLTVFIPKLFRTKWDGAGKYGRLVSTYMEDFDNKWIAGTTRDGEQLLGTSDIQSLADISNSYTVIGQMGIVPFRLSHVGIIAAVSIAPLLPLTLFIFSVEELLDKLVQILM
jgi:hypothetical protein